MKSKEIRPTSIRIPDDLKKKIQKKADANNRTLSNQIIITLKNSIK
jgi:predicted transcriptional regulator